jgi:hypothetical protein
VSFSEGGRKRREERLKEEREIGEIKRKERGHI